MDRRTFIKRAGAGVAAAGLAGPAAHAARGGLARTSIGQIKPLEAPGCVPDEAVVGAFEDLGIRHLAELERLPWFEKGDRGAICLKESAGVVPVIDVHAHLGWELGFGRDIDMAGRDEVQYYYDFRRGQDLLHEQDHPSDDEAESIVAEGIEGLVHTPKRNQSHTAANLSTEMDRMGFQNIVLLPVEFPGMSGRHAKATMEAGKCDSRFVPFGAVHPFPWGARKANELQHQVDKYAIKGIKLHPEFQFVAPENRNTMAMFEWCEANDVIVLSHSGYTGREPKALRSKAEPERFAEPLKAFPKLRLVLAHTGIRRIDQALEVARKFEDQVWVDISGQPAPNIRYILERYNTEKILFGSDWPFFPLAVMLARALVATEGCDEVRDNLLHHNTRRLLG